MNWIVEAHHVKRGFAKAVLAEPIVKFLFNGIPPAGAGLLTVAPQLQHSDWNSLSRGFQNLPVEFQPVCMHTYACVLACLADCLPVCLPVSLTDYLTVSV